MTFIDVSLSRRVNAGFSGGPQWSTTKVPMTNGFDRKNANWSMPHHKYQANYAILDPQQQNEILAAFWAARGIHSFRFKDWNDFRIINEAMSVGDGTTTPRQLTKTYFFGPSSYTRAIKLPIATSISVTANGTPIAVTVDDETGMITPSSVWPSGQVIKVKYCEFDVKVCFGSDYYPFTQQASALSDCTIDLVEDFAA